MKRLHLFEVEDLTICPDWIRDCVTSMIVVVHRWFGVPQVVADQIELLLADQNAESVTIVDVCSGSGGPMLGALGLIAAKQSADRSVKLVLTDIKPQSRLVAQFAGSESNIQYLEKSLDACLPLLEQLSEASIDDGVTVVQNGSLMVRTLICGFHHLPPEQAKRLLQDAQKSDHPLVIFELTDGTVPPRWLWWVTLLPNFLFGLLVSLFARPVTFRGVVFSFLVPIIPACFAWDGAVTSARTYREAEFYDLIETLPAREGYQWEFKTVPGAVAQFSLMIGRPHKR